MASVAELRIAHRIPLSAWLPLAVLPCAVGVFLSDWPSWVFMWALAFSIYAGLKWLSFFDSIEAAEQLAFSSGP